MQEPAGGLLKPRTPVAIVRLDDLAEAIAISQALLEGGITEIEFTLTNKQALKVVSEIKREFGDRLIVGTGTVLDEEAALASIQAGAQFMVTPVLTPDVIKTGNSHGLPVVCGAFTPTEIWTAHRLGAEYVKVFPAGQLSPSYIKDVLAPLPGIRIVATGNVGLENYSAFLAAGSYKIGVGGQLVGKEIVRKKDWPALTALARRFMEASA